MNHPAMHEGRPIGFQADPGPQTRFLELANVFEVMYGGAAGGGKTTAACIDFLRYVGQGYRTNYKGVLFRRVQPEIEKALVPETMKWFPMLGGRYKEHKKMWVFPEGEICYLGHAQFQNDIKAYLGSEMQFIYFDELTTFLEYQYTYAMSRLRSSQGIPVRMRAGTNPGSDGHEWVFRRFAPWLDPKSKLKASSGQVLYFIIENDKPICVPKGTRDSDGNLARGRVFIAAKSDDNRHLDADYKRTLMELDPVTREQLRNGNWLIRPAKGLYYKRAWFEFVEAAPAEMRWVRAWDLAATEARKGKGDPDWTVGAKLGVSLNPNHAGLFFIGDVVRMRGAPGDVEATIKATAELDGKNTMVVMPRDPGQAGVDQVRHYAKLLAGFNVRFRIQTGDKTHRQNPFSAQCARLVGNVKIVRGEWNEAFLQVLEAFPEGSHDDDVDAAATAFNELVTGGDYVPPGDGDVDTSNVVESFGGF